MKTLHDKDITIEEVQELINNGADINKKNALGMTPLYIACKHYKTELIKFLIKNGADVTIQNTSGFTPLYILKDMAIIQLLIENGINVNTQDIEGSTPLHFVESEDIARLLIDHGADVNIRNNYGYTPFCTTLDLSIQKLLIHYDALPSTIAKYQQYRDLFSEEQRKAFDTFQSITGDDENFFQMCLAYQNDIKNNVKIEIKEMDIQ